MQKWEYFQVDLEVTNLNRAWLKLINDYGLGGWELVSVVSDGIQWNKHFFFKRPLP
jgi:hypothetical protein